MGRSSLIVAGLDATRKGGTTVMVGVPALDDPLTYPLPTLLAAGGKNLLGQGLGELEDLFRLLQGHHASFGQRQASSCGPQQLTAQVTLELAHLSAHGLYRHVQPLGSPRHAALLGHDPEVIQMTVVEAQTHIQDFMELDSFIFFFFRCFLGFNLHGRSKTVHFF